MAVATILFFCNLKQVLPLLFIASFFFFTSFSISASSETQPHTNIHQLYGRRILLEAVDDEDQQPIIKNKISTTFSPTKNKITTSILKASTKNQTKKIIKPKLIMSDLVKKNKTKLIKPTSNLTNEEKLAIKSHLKKMNSTLKSSSNSKSAKNTTKKSSDLSSKTSSSLKNNTEKPMSKNQEKEGAMKLPSWADSNDDDDLESGFTDLPSKFQETLVPDLERISKTSQVYIKKANKEITRGFKPFVGNNYAATIASLVTFTFILLPFILVSLIINKIKAYFSLQKILFSIQAYLSIYFSTLCLSSLASGLEPFRFLYATSQSTYVCLQILQTLAYMLYLLLLLMYLILVFSTKTGMPTKLLGLGQTFVGLVVGLHYYMMVFHRAVLHEPPKTSWRVHAIYATCFFVLCVFTGADRRKKCYSDSDDVGKVS